MVFSLFAAVGIPHASAATQPVYRAVLIGNNYPGTPNELRGCINDATGIKEMLEANVFENDARFSNINLVTNATRQMIINAINTTFAGATSNDVSYFTYSGHGSRNGNTSYICTIDPNWLSVDDLELLLRNIPGKVVILLDSCHSGGFIGKSAFEQEKETEAFNNDVISAFNVASKAYLTGEKYRVITACSKDEYSYEINSPTFGKYMGQFTSNLLIGCGHSKGSLAADTNSDKKITMSEAYTYTKKTVTYSSVKASPETSNDVLFQYCPTSTSANVANGVYRIQGLGSGKYVDIKNGSIANGAETHLWENASVDSQKFHFERLSDGTYKITAVHSGKSLEVRNNGMNNGDSVAQWDFDANYACKRWYIVDCGNGYYKLLNKNSGKVLDVSGNGTANGTRIQQYEDNGTTGQRFRLIPASESIANGIYRIQGLGSGKYVDIKNGSVANGAETHLWENASVNSQKFRFERLSDGTYKITAVHSGKSLEVRDSGMNNGDSVAQWDFDANYACKRWFIVDCGNGYYKLMNKNSGKVLDVSGNGTANGTRIQQYEDNGTTAQRFRLILI